MKKYDLLSLIDKEKTTKESKREKQKKRWCPRKDLSACAHVPNHLTIFIKKHRCTCTLDKNLRL